MADNAVYDAGLGPATPALEATRENIQRDTTLQSQGTMIAPSPLEMSPEEKLLSYEKQAGRYNPGGDVDMASNYKEAQQAAQAFKEQASAEETEAASTLNPDTDFLDNAATLKTTIEQKKLDMAGPLYSKLKAQDDLNNAAQTLEINRQGNIAEKQEIQQAQVDDYKKFKTKYDNNMQTRMAEIDSQLVSVAEDAKLSRQSTAELFQQKGSGAKVAAGIAMLLGAAGGVMSGSGRNMGMETVSNVLESERKHLIANFANSKEMLTLKRQNIDDYNESMIRQMAVADRQKMLQLQVVSTKLDMFTSKYSGSAAGAAALNSKADINMQIQSIKMQVSQSEAMNSLFAKGATIDDLPLQAAAQMLGQKPGEILKDRRERTVVLPGNKPVYATDPGSANKARDIVGASEIIQKEIKHVADIVKASPVAVKGGFLTKSGTEAQASMGRITAAMKGLEALGALDNGVILLVSNIIKDPTSLINQANYERIGNDLKMGANDRLESFGVRGYAVPRGNYKFNKAAAGSVDASFSKYLKNSK